MLIQPRFRGCTPAEIKQRLHDERQKRRVKLAIEQTKESFDHYQEVCDKDNHEITKQIVLSEVINRVVALAQIVSEKQYYPYQTNAAYRLVESVLLHDGDVITALFSRQSGKTQMVGSIVAALMIILPYLCNLFPKSWHLNITDDKGVYRGFKEGVEIGIYAPRKEQARIAFDRVKECFDRKATMEVMQELGITVETFNGNSIKLSNGSAVKSESASEQSKIEGESYHLLILEEAQDITDLKIRKSLHPMVASTMGTILKVGTSKAERCDFYFAIKENIRSELAGSTRKNHFIYPYTICQRYNSRYRDYVQKEKARIGEDSDEFKMSYGCVWIFERGMFTTQDVLFQPSIATVGLRPWCFTWPLAQLPKQFSYYSTVAGIDWGSSHDSTVITTVAVNWQNPEQTIEHGGTEEVQLYKKHITSWREHTGDDYETQFWEIFEYLKSMPNLKKIVTDSNTCGLPIFHRLIAAFAPLGIEVEAFNFSAKVKSEGYKSFYQDICGKRFTFPASQTVRKTLEYRKFVNQMLDLRKKYNNGMMLVSHPDEKHAHDDYPDSAMMACWGANKIAGMGELEFSANNPFYANAT